MSLSFRFLWLVAIALIAGPAAALTPPPRGADWDEANARIFLQNEVTRVDITILPEDFQFFLDNVQTEEFRPATVRWRNSVLDETVDQVAFSIRGNTSRNSARKSWKLEFRKIVADRTFHGLEEANLNGSNNDPSLIRTMLAWELIRRMRLPASRTHLVALYINGTFWSLQTHVEHIDEEFAEARFGEKEGNLWKCLYGGARADLNPVPGEDYAGYAGGSVYSERNNDDNPARNYSDLADFIRFIDQATDQQFLEGLEYHLDTDGFLRHLASDVALGSWDNYWYGSNNYYLYHMDLAGRFVWIPYDYDNSFGIDFFNTNWSTRNFDGWGNGGYGTQPAPLVDRVFEHSEWRRQYRRYLAQAATILEDPAFQAKATTWFNLVTPYMNGTIESGGVVGNQPYLSQATTRPTTWNGSGADDGHRIGVLPYITARASSLRSQLAGISTPALPTVRINEVQASNRATIEDQPGEFDDWIELHNFGATPVDVSGMHLSDDVTSPTLYQLPSGTVIPAGGFLLVWADDQPLQGGLHAPFRLDAAGEHLGLFHTTASGRVLIDDFAYPAVPTDDTYGRYPDSSDTTQILQKPTPGAPNDNTEEQTGEPRTPPRLFINEFMASNTSTITNPASGGFDDWVEIYNDEPTAVDMSGMGLTDALANTTKWLFPAGTTIPAKGFLLVWCDDAAATGLHASFRLSKGGEALGLFDNEENQRQLIHSFTFGAQTDNVTQGFRPDGQGNLATLPAVTPGSTNDPRTPESWMLW